MPSAMEAAGDPLRLVRAVQEAEDEEDAVLRVGATFGVDDDLAERGPPFEATPTVQGRRQGVVTVDGLPDDSPSADCADD